MKKTLITSMLTAALFMLCSFSNATTLNSTIGDGDYSSVSLDASNELVELQAGWTGYGAGTKAGNGAGRVANRLIAAAELLYAVYVAATHKLTVPDSSNTVQGINYNSADLSEFN